MQGLKLRNLLLRGCTVVAGTLNPTPEYLNPRRDTPKPRPQTLNPKTCSCVGLRWQRRRRAGGARRIPPPPPGWWRRLPARSPPGL